MLHLQFFPPAVEQRRYPAGLDDAHVTDDPRWAVSHGDCDAVAFGNAPCNESVRHALGNAVELAELQPLLPRDNRLDIGVQSRKGPEQPRQRRRQVLDDGASLGVAADDQPPARRGDRRQRLIEPAVELRRHLRPALLCLCGHPPYEALSHRRGSPCKPPTIQGSPSSPIWAFLRLFYTSDASTFAGTALPISRASSSVTGICSSWSVSRARRSPAVMPTIWCFMRRWESSSAAVSATCCSTISATTSSIRLR